MELISDPSSLERYDSVLVVGAGIAGIQAALDLSAAGHHVFMVERAPYVGGMVVRLDKMFPTNDCSFCTLAPRDCFLCIRSPRFIDYGRQHRIDLLSGAELVGLAGIPGNFTAEVLELPRYVDAERCTACGRCAEVCPVELEDEFNETLGRRRAAFRPHPQSHPGVYAIDPAACNRCGRCIEVCPEHCIDLDMAEQSVQLHVGAVVLCPGFEPFRPTSARHLGYGVHPDVVTAVEFERLISASGPTAGQLRRPSDGRLPGRIAWVQCVGSRDPAADRGYCSTVCCMYAVKQAVLARELLGDSATGTIFGMDVRAYGKGYYQYFDDAQAHHGVRFVRCRVFEVGTVGGSLSIRYSLGPGEVHREEFDMVVLSVGLCAPSRAAQLAQAAGIELNGYGFCKTPALAPVLTSRPGVFVAGSFGGPKDIPDTVTEASAAAAEAVGLLGMHDRGPWSDLRVRPERGTGDDEPRIGVVLCRCGTRLADALSLTEVARYGSSLDDVAWVETVDRACAPEGQDAIFQMVARGDVNRVVLAACSPRNYELLFRDTLREAGLNGYMLEMANLLEHCALVHPPGLATDEKAKDLLRMAVGRCRLLEPLARPLSRVTPAALVLGGGIAGLTCASFLLRQGHEVYLVEKGQRLGGTARRVESTIEGMPVRPYVEALAARVAAHPNAHVLAQSRLESLGGEPGTFAAQLRVGPEGKRVEMRVGAVVIATGGREYEPAEYLHGLDPRVVTQLGLEEMLSRSDPRATSAQAVAMIQCVGSRSQEHPYCSRVCCAQAIKNALRIKQLNPVAELYILHRDVATYGLAEEYYREAREKGVVFLRWDAADPPRVEQVETGAGTSGLRVTVTETALGQPVAIDVDLVVLAAAMLPSEDNPALAATLGVPLGEDGFFLESHAKLRPVEFAREGIFLCGLAHGPKSAREQVAQAAAAAAKASALLAQTRSLIGTEVAVVEGRCIACRTCARVCPFGAPRLVSGRSRIDPAVCQGCGVCVAQCPAGAIQLLNSRNEQLTAQVAAWMEGVS